MRRTFAALLLALGAGAAFAATIVGTDAPGRLAGSSGAGNDAVNVGYLDDRLTKDTVDRRPGTDTIIDTNLRIRTPDAYQNCEKTIAR